MKIVILDAKTLGTVPNISEIGKFGEVVAYDTTPPELTGKRVSDADIVITNKVIINEAVMRKCPRLKLICISATGMNNVELDAAKKHGIVVKNAAGYSSHSVAQHTFAMIFQLANQLNYYDRYVKSGQYAKSDIFTHYGPPSFELHGKNYGIIGMGDIGKTVANIAEGFGAEVCYYSTSGKNTRQNYPSVTMAELLKSSDIISIHAPLNEQTQNLIRQNQLEMMKTAAILVNVGRGGIVHEGELAEALDDQKIGGACVDVFGIEPIEADNPLLKVKHPERLVLSPHNAWASIQARTKLIDIVIENIRSFLEKKL
jgi:lactate dehydrogenase-like 2-hydroxyacid dehydrogenase